MDKEYFASINEVSKRLSVPAYTLRYWEKQFPTAIKPTTGAGGRRYYRTDTFNKLVIIKELLYTRGMTIAGVKKLLKEGTFPDTVDDISNIGAQQYSAPAASAPKLDAGMLDLAINLLEQAKEQLKTI